MRRRDALPDPEVDRALRELDAALADEPIADPDLTTLVADVRAARPEPSAPFLAELDARVHSGFAREREERRQRWFARRWALAPAAGGVMIAALVALVVVVGSGDGGGTTSDSASSSGAAAKAPVLKPEVLAATPEARLDSASGSVSGRRQVERAAQLTLTPAPDKVQDTADGVVRTTQSAGGYVQQSNISTRAGGGEASFTLRIPSARLDDALQQLSKLAHVGGLTQSSDDITTTVASASDRLADARAERQALLKALGAASTDRRIASLKARLRDNQAQIAQRQAELNGQRRRADLATVDVTIEAKRGAVAPPKDDGRWGPGDALRDAGRVLEVAGSVAVVAASVLLPIALLALLAGLAARTLRRHRREGALDA